MTREEREAHTYKAGDRAVLIERVVWFDSYSLVLEASAIITILDEHSEGLVQFEHDDGIIRKVWKHSIEPHASTEKHSCRCPIETLFGSGCQCGGT